MVASDKTPHQQLHQVVSERLRAEILRGNYKPGQWLRQKKIAEEFGVSQMPVREALKELAAEGLVEHIPYRGVRVVKFTHQDVTDIYAQRACLESRAVAAVAVEITDAQLQQFKTLQVQLEDWIGPDHICEYRKLNREFHQALYRLSGRGYLIRTLDQMWSTFPTMLFDNFPKTSEMPLENRSQTDITEHRDIITALEQRDAEAAEKAVRRHIESVCRDFLRTLNGDQN